MAKNQISVDVEFQGEITQTDGSGNVLLKGAISPPSYSLFGQGAATSVNYYFNPTAVGGRQYGIAGIISAGAQTGTAQALQAVGIYGAAQTGAGNSDIWGSNFLVQWNSGDTDVNVQGIEVDINNNASNTYTYTKTGITINSGGSYNCNQAIQIGAPGAGKFNIGMYLAPGSFLGSAIQANGGSPAGTGALNFSGQQSANGDDTLCLGRNTDTSPTGYFARFFSAGGGSTLFQVAIDGSVFSGAEIAGSHFNSSDVSSLLGTSGGSINYSQPMQGQFKSFAAQFLSYENDTATNQTIAFATAFGSTPVVTTNTTGLTVSASTTALTITAPNSTTTYTGLIKVEGF